MQYRAEIDGLRCIAVLGVIVFHLNSLWLPGGFLGVDVFFVISGYLITSIIVSETAEGAFKIKRFWLRRAKRLAPALIFMVGVVLIAGHFVLIRPGRLELPGQALASLFSFANIYFWRTTGGYWTSHSESIPLLNIWSLSLEEQFYFCYPLIFMALQGRGTKVRNMALIALATCSFALCIVATPMFRSASFYLLPTRAWELLLGGLLACFHVQHKQQNQCSGMKRFLPDFGLAIILASFVLLPNSEHFPGWRPLVPCAGTLLVLHARIKTGTPSFWLLQNRICVFFGKISYSLYLWHWPVFVLLPYSGISSPIVKLLITFLLATGSYFLIEKPTRYGFRGAGFGWMLAPGVATVGFFLLTFYPSSPLLRDLGNLDSGESLTRGRAFEAIEILRNGGAGVSIGETGDRPVICIYGSSHARVLGEPVSAYAKSCGWGFRSLATSDVGITSLSRAEVDDAEEINAARLTLIRELQPEVTIVAGMWSGEQKRNDFPHAIEKALEEIAANTGKVLVLSQVPMVNVPKEYHNDLRKFLISRSLSGLGFNAKPHFSVARANEIVHEAVRKLDRDDISFVDISSVLLDRDQVRLVERQRFLYSDYHHVNHDGARLVFDGALQALLDSAVAMGVALD